MTSQADNAIGIAAFYKRDRAEDRVRAVWRRLCPALGLPRSTPPPPVVWKVSDGGTWGEVIQTSPPVLHLSGQAMRQLAAGEPEADRMLAHEIAHFYQAGDVARGRGVRGPEALAGDWAAAREKDALAPKGRRRKVKRKRYRDRGQFGQNWGLPPEQVVK